MQRQSQKTKLSILAHYVDQWRARAGSRETVATEIVEAHIAAGYNTRAKLQFETHGDAFMLAKSRADRIFRWLDDKTKDNNFMPPNFEDSVLLAMPEDLRLAYLNEWLSGFGMRARGLEEVEVSGSAIAHLKAVSKESAEATSAMADLLDGATESELVKAEQELAEQEEATSKARVYVASLRRAKRAA